MLQSEVSCTFEVSESLVMRMVSALWPHRLATLQVSAGVFLCHALVDETSRRPPWR